MRYPEPDLTVVHLPALSGGTFLTSQRDLAIYIKAFAQLQADAERLTRESRHPLWPDPAAQAEQDGGAWALGVIADRMPAPYIDVVQAALNNSSHLRVALNMLDDIPTAWRTDSVVKVWALAGKAATHVRALFDLGLNARLDMP